MNRSLRAILVVVLGVVVLLVGLAGGALLDRRVLLPAVGSVPAGAGPDFQLMAEAWKTISQRYVDRSAIQPQQMTYAAISGMVDSLGDVGHSRFMDPAMAKQQQNELQGQLEGVGLYVQMKDGHVVILAAIDGTPAHQAGLRTGDIILKVNGQNVAGLSLDQVVGRVAGPAGTSVTLTILSPRTGVSRDVTLVRARITLHNVTWAALPGTTVAHLRILVFSQGLGQDLRQALASIEQAKMRAIILDLRGSPGGLLSEAVATASEFLRGGNVLLEKDVQGRVSPVPVQAGGLASDIPLVVLVNGGTASAAEIVAGALQDAGRAQLVGEQTFGTGTVLNEFPLSDGSQLLLATEEWLTPAGRVIWHKGLAPDVVVTLTADVAPLFPEAETDLTPGQLQSSRDAQLLRALQLLRPGAADSARMWRLLQSPRAGRHLWADLCRRPRRPCPERVLCCLLLPAAAAGAERTGGVTIVF